MYSILRYMEITIISFVGILNADKLFIYIIKIYPYIFSDYNYYSSLL